jgi:hypothetical protein
MRYASRLRRRAAPRPRRLAPSRARAEGAFQRAEQRRHRARRDIHGPLPQWNERPSLNLLYRQVNVEGTVEALGHGGGSYAELNFADGTGNFIEPLNACAALLLVAIVVLIVALFGA